MAHPENRPNRLVHEKSPYLQQHADNPVDWYPWGEEAFAKARQEDKPVLVSIGYSTCHWCHVMAEESFSDQGVAEIMNRYFVCIKIDREERPDLDTVYITAVSALTGSAGWPLNVFLTPTDLKPFFGGTYFPRMPHPRMPAWPDLLVQIGKAWKNSEQRQKILASAETLTRMLRNHLAESRSDDLPEGQISDAPMEEALSIFQRSYDQARGGFGDAPKFPSPSTLNFLLSHAYRYKGSPAGSSAREMALHTLRAMARGGMYDQLGGGFHRYSVDADWHVPHFEKMLYDNAQLVSTYVSAYQSTGEDFFRVIAEETLGYVLREMTHEEGGFFSAQDADSLPGAAADASAGHDKVEGAFYVWTYDEIHALLDPPVLPVFTYVYGVEAGGNVQADPSGEFRNKNILYARHTVEEAMLHFQKPMEAVRSILAEARSELMKARRRRPRPHLDDKIIVSWNGLMISALARAYQIIRNPRYADAAEKAATFIRAHLYDNQNRMLYRIWREGERKINAMASDYAFLIQGLIDLYEATFQYRWLQWAKELATDLTPLFSDTQKGGLFMTREDHDPNLLMRVKEEGDSVLPAAGSIAAMSLWKLFHYTGNSEFQSRAEKIALSAITNPSLHPASIPQMLVTLDTMLADPVQIAVAGQRSDPQTRDLLKVIHQTVHPGKTVFLVEEDQAWRQVCSHAYLQDVRPVNGIPAAYVCAHNTCQKPVTNSKALARLLA